MNKIYKSDAAIIDEGNGRYTLGEEDYDMNDDNYFKEISFTDILKTRSIYVPNFIF